MFLFWNTMCNLLLTTLINVFGVQKFQENQSRNSKLANIFFFTGTGQVLSEFLCFLPENLFISTNVNYHVGAHKTFLLLIGLPVCRGII